MADLARSGTSAGDLAGFQRHLCRRVEESLAETFAAQRQGEVCAAARYCVLAGGHRWRAMIAAAAARIFPGGRLEAVLPAACALELVHAASLVLDDLPSMDDGTLRRGKPCVHLVFPRWSVDMLPAYLILLAQELLLENPLVASNRRIAAAVEISRAAVLMTHGQELDLTRDTDGRNDAGWLWECYRLKSGRICGAAAKAGAILGGADPFEAQRLGSFGLRLGTSYQLLDDVADVEAGVEELGKEPGMDDGKVTAVTLFGIEGARARAEALREEALAELDCFGEAGDLLRQIAGRLSSVSPSTSVLPAETRRSG